MHAHENLIPLRGKEKEVTGELCKSFRRLRAERDKKEQLRGTFVSVFVEG